MKNEEKIFRTITRLNIEFYKIQCRNWILSKSNGNGAAGRTLEILLNKKNDTYALPDFYEIEIKTKLIGSESNITLFSMVFDNKPLEIQRLLRIGGYPDKLHPEFKIFYLCVHGNFKKKMGYRFSYQIKVDYSFQVVRLCIFNRYGALIDQRMSWSFEQLKSRLEHKLSYLAFILAKKCKLHGQDYFKYLSISFYRLRSFETFLKLLETGIISVSFKLGYFKSGEHYGEIYDHGTSFDISKEDLEKLFEPIYLDLYSNVVRIGMTNVQS